MSIAKQIAEDTFSHPCGDMTPETERQILRKIGQIREFQGCCMDHKMRYLADSIAVAAGTVVMRAPSDIRSREIDEAEAIAHELVKMAFNRVRLLANPTDTNRAT